MGLPIREDFYSVNPTLPARWDFHVRIGNNKVITLHKENQRLSCRRQPFLEELRYEVSRSLASLYKYTPE